MLYCTSFHPKHVPYSQVGTNGYFTFNEFSGYFIDGNDSVALVAPFFTDIDISQGVGRIDYEIHTEATSEAILHEVNSLVNEHAQTEFNGKWMLVATWDDVPPYGDTSVVSFIHCNMLVYSIIVFFTE